MSPFRAALFAGLLLFPAVAWAQSATPPNPSFNLVNRGAAAIREFFATPSGRTNWGRDRLDGKGLAPGAKAPIRLPADGNCNYDLRATFADGRIEDRRGLDVCATEDVAVGEATTAKTFVLLNRGTAPVIELSARPAGTDKWSSNRMKEGPIAPGSQREFPLPPGGQCAFDLRVTFAGGLSREKRNADLCRAPVQAVQ